MTGPVPPDCDHSDARLADWPRGWEEHKRRQLASFLAATPAQRLAWLEEMIELAHRSGALPRPRAATAWADGEPERTDR
ncbi:MAG: hypothetical protein HY907_07760 [Deltaproteobacteria bacterium]|nr:hypothetical protein [Deltaproteobacteria bacterium]